MKYSSEKRRLVTLVRELIGVRRKRKESVQMLNKLKDILSSYQTNLKKKKEATDILILHGMLPLLNSLKTIHGETPPTPRSKRRRSERRKTKVVDRLVDEMFEMFESTDTNKENKYMGHVYYLNLVLDRTLASRDERSTLYEGFSRWRGVARADDDGGDCRRPAIINTKTPTLKIMTAQSLLESPEVGTFNLDLPMTPSLIPLKGLEMPKLNRLVSYDFPPMTNLKPAHSSDGRGSHGICISKESDDYKAPTPLNCSDRVVSFRNQERDALSVPALLRKCSNMSNISIGSDLSESLYLYGGFAPMETIGDILPHLHSSVAVSPLRSSSTIFKDGRTARFNEVVDSRPGERLQRTSSYSSMRVGPGGLMESKSETRTGRALNLGDPSPRSRKHAKSLKQHTADTATNGRNRASSMSNGGCSCKRSSSRPLGSS